MASASKSKAASKSVDTSAADSSSTTTTTTTTTMVVTEETVATLQVAAQDAKPTKANRGRKTKATAAITAATSSETAGDAENTSATTTTTSNNKEKSKKKDQTKEQQQQPAQEKKTKETKSAKHATATTTTETEKDQSSSEVTTPAAVAATPTTTIAAAAATTSTTTTTISTVMLMHAKSGRDLPIFCNPLIANSNFSDTTTSLAVPKAGSTKKIAVLKLRAPKADGEVVIIRRMDLNLVNATAMFRAAYPAASDKMEAREMSFVESRYGEQISTDDETTTTTTTTTTVVKETSGQLAGIWVPVEHAKELAKEYGIDLFMQPLFEVPATGSKADGKDKEVKKDETAVTEDTEKQVDSNEAAQEDKELEQEAEGSSSNAQTTKRRIEEVEDEDEARNRKRLRGLVTLAIGVAAVSVIPQVLPYFS